MAKATFGDISVFTLGGVDLLGAINDIGYKISADKDEGGAIAYIGESPQLTGAGVEISTTALSNIVGSGRVSDLDLTAFTIGGTTYRTKLKQFSLKGSYTHQETSARGDKFHAPQVTNKAYSGSAELFVLDSAAPDLMGTLLGSTSTTNNSTISVTINGVTITLPVLITQHDLAVPYGGLQMLSMSFDGRALLTVDPYPTLPTGTTTLLEKALNDPLTALAYDIKTRATNGVRLQGNMIWNSFDLSVNERQIIKTQYSWLGTGTVTVT